jgi:hypothetical protein
MPERCDKCGRDWPETGCECGLLICDDCRPYHECDGGSDEMPKCEWFLMCKNDAAGTADHPVLGRVPICERCAGMCDQTVSSFPPADEPLEEWEQALMASAEEEATEYMRATATVEHDDPPARSEYIPADVIELRFNDPRFH